MAEIDSPSPMEEIVRPYASHRMTPEEEETFEKRGRLNENDTVLLEIIDESKNCLLGRETMKVVRETDVKIASDTPLKLKVFKREEFFIDDSLDETVSSMELGQARVDPELVFEAVTWIYDVVKDSSALKTEGKEAKALAKDTTWQDYYGPVESISGPMTFTWKMWPVGWELGSVKAVCRSHYKVKPRHNTIPRGHYLGNVRGLVESAYAAPAHSLNGSVSIDGKVNTSSNRDSLIPQLDLTMNYKFTELGVSNHNVSCEWRANGYYGLRWKGWKK